MHDPVTLILMYGLVPLWIAAGFADWLCHRRSDIEHTAGPKESMIHLLMFVEVGIPLMLALICEVNALVLLVALIMFFVHEATALWDVSFAVTKRVVSPIEQHVHSFLEMIPLMAIALLAVSHWEQMAALFRLGSELPEFRLVLKDPPLPGSYLVIVLSAAFLLSLLPYLFELRRGMCARTGIDRTLQGRKHL